MKNKTQLDGMPVWFDGKSINEALFCEEFLQTHKIIFTSGAFFTPEGRVTDELPLGDFIEINDEFYIMDLDYYKKIFGDKKFLDFLKKSDRDKIQSLLKIQQDIELIQEGANANEIKKNYSNLSKSKCSESDENYDKVKDTIDILYTLVPYRRTLCIADNMVVLNDKYMRDKIEMTSFKFGGKIKVLGYITNKIKADANDMSNISPLAQVGIGLNQIMLSFFGQHETLNIVHPIAIYYE